jgi:hypothetical protein
VVDADGDEVGLVTNVSSGYYGQSASIVRELSAPGGSGTEWFLFGIGREGFVAAEYGTEFIFATPACDETPYVYSYTAYSNADPLAFPVTVASDGTRGFFHRPSETVTRQFHFVDVVSGSPAGALLAECTDPPPPPASFDLPGRPIGSAFLCDESFPGTFCLECCRPVGRFRGGVPVPFETGGAPAREIDILGLDLVPPFRLSR